MIGRIVIANNPNMVSNVVRSGPSQIILLDEEGRNSQDTICGSILLPPFSIMNELVDGRLDLRIIEDQYFGYLHSTEPMAFVVGLIAIMLKGINVIIVADRYDNEFSMIPKTIWNFFNMRYGIVPETISTAFLISNDPMHWDTIYSDLFLYDYIDDTVLKAKHSPSPYNPVVQNKLINLYNFRALNNNSDKPIDPFVNMRG